MPVAKTLPPEDDEYQRTVAPELAVAPNVTVPFPHTEPGVVPVIVGSAFIVTDNVRAVLLPQLLFAVTLIFPLCAFASGVADILVLVELPDHPLGKVHV